MTSPVPTHSGAARSLRRALWLVAAGAVLLGVVQVVISESSSGPGLSWWC